MIEIYKSQDKPIVTSDFMLGSWLSVIIVLIGIGAGIVISLDLPVVANIFLFAFFVFISVYISSYFFLNRAAFFQDRIEMRHVIKHGSQKKAVVNLSSVYLVKYEYIGGKGSAGNGQVKIYYRARGKEMKLKCSIDNNTAAKLFSMLQQQNIEVEIQPPYILKRYGFKPDNKS